MSNYIDTHCHIDLYKKYHNIINTIEEKKVYTIGVTNTPSVFSHFQDLITGKKYIRAALGFHPQLVKKRYKEINIFKKLVMETKYIGEVGLDYSNINKEEKKLQRKCFLEILEECEKYGNKIFSIHSRKSVEDVLAIVSNKYSGKFIFHWFSGNMKNLKRAINNGYYFSINLKMTDTNKGKKIIKSVPINKILTETDGPYIEINNKPCKPSDVRIVVRKLSNILSIEIKAIKEIIFRNFKSLFDERNNI